jgi:acyl carrier protein
MLKANLNFQSDTQLQVLALIAQHFLLPLESVHLDSQLVYDLGADSSDLLDLSIQLSERFDCDLDTGRLARVTRVADYCRLVEAALVRHPADALA